MDIVIPSSIIKGTISGKKNKDQKYEKAKLQRITKDGNDIIQVSLFTAKQVFHVNCTDNDINDKLIDLLSNEFNNMELVTSEFTYSYRITSKGKVLSNRKKNKVDTFVTVTKAS